MKILKRILSLTLLLCFAISFVACSGGGNYFYKNKSEDIIFKYGDYSITKNIYGYWMSRYKAVLMYQYSDVDDTNEFWDGAYGNSTANELFTSYSDETIKNYLVSMYLFDFYKLSLSQSKLSEVEKQLSEIVADGYDGNIANLNKEAYEFGINYDMLREIYLAEAKTEAVYDYVVKNVINTKLTDEARQSYLEDNYAHTTHIFVNTSFKYNVDKDGNVIYDENGSNTTKLTEDEKKAKEKIVAELDSTTVNTVNFFDLQKKYNEDPAIDVYKNGYFVSTNIEFDTAYVTAALTMKEGEIKRVEGQNGVFYIYKQTMTEKAYEDKDNADFFVDYDDSVGQYLYWGYMSELYKNIEINSELKKDINLKTVSPCWYF